MHCPGSVGRRREVRRSWSRPDTHTERTPEQVSRIMMHAVSCTYTGILQIFMTLSVLAYTVFSQSFFCTGDCSHHSE